MEIKKNQIKIGKIGLTSFFLIFIIWIYFAGNTSNPDYQNYENLYNLINTYNINQYSSIEVLFFWMMKGGTYFGLSYQQFLMVLSTLFVFLITFFLRKTSNMPAFVLSAYLFFPFFLDVIQIRNSIAYAIVLNGMVYLLDNKYYKYVIAVIIATGFHSSSIFYLIFLIYKINWRYLFGLVFSTIIFLTFFGNQMLSLLITVFPAGYKYLIYINNIRYEYVLIYAVVFGINWYVAISLEKRLIKLNMRNKIPEMILRFSSFAKQIALLSFILIPLLAIDANFFRLFRNLLLIFLINFFNYYSVKIYIKNIKYFVTDLVFLIYYGIIGYYFLYIYQYESVFLQILQNNLFLK